MKDHHKRSSLRWTDLVIMLGVIAVLAGTLSVLWNGKNTDFAGYRMETVLESLIDDSATGVRGSRR